MTISRRLIAGAAAALGVGATGWLLFGRDETTDSDTTGVVVGKVAVTQGSPALGTRAVEVLSQHLGEHGEATKGKPGYHRSPFIDAVLTGVYGDGRSLIGKAWCARAVRWAYETAAQELGLPAPFAKVKGTLAMATSWKESPMDKFKLRTPKVGAALVLGNTHATLIAKVIDDGTVVTIEGNHGDAVANVKRPIKPEDTIVDVEAYVASMSGKAPRVAVQLIAGLGLLGAVRAGQP